MIYEYPPFNALTLPAKAFRVAADIAQAFGGLIWMLILLTGLGLAAMGMYRIGAEFGSEEAWIKGCALFAGVQACDDTQLIIRLRDHMALDRKVSGKEFDEAAQHAQIAEFCKGLPDKLAAYAHCPGRD